MKKKPLPNDYIERAIEAASVRLMHARALHSMLDYVAREIMSASHSSDEEATRAWLTLSAKINLVEGNAASDLLMFSAFPSKKARTVSLKLLAERFCEKHIPYQVMDLLQTHSGPVSSYYEADEKAFRAAVVEAIARAKKDKTA